MSRGFNPAPFPGMGFRKVGGMPKENINCIAMDKFRAEVSWRRAEYICPNCDTRWSPVTDGTPNYCPECDRPQVLPVSGHVQLATVNPARNQMIPVPFDGWYVTLDQDAIERTVDALIRAGAAAFPNWKRDWSTEEPPGPDPEQGGTTADYEAPVDFKGPGGRARYL